MNYPVCAAAGQCSVHHASIIIGSVLSLQVLHTVVHMYNNKAKLQVC